MSDKELTDAEYEALLSGTCDNGALNVSTHSDTSDTSDDDERDSTSQPYAQRYPAMRKLLEMQRELTDTVLDGGTKPQDKASCARAWKELEVLRRIILGKHVTVEPAKAKAKLNASPMLTLEPTSQDQQAAA